MSVRAAAWSVATAVASAGVAGAWASQSPGEPTTPVTTGASSLTAVGAPVAEPLLPGRTVTGTLLVQGARSATTVDVVEFAPPVADRTTCARSGVAVAPTLSAPLEVPALGSRTLEWTAYMDGNGDHGCQGATLTSQVVLDGEPAGTVTLHAATLEQPPAPVAGLTTSTRAAVHWSGATAADPGWVVERTLAGTDDWRPACRSSPARPVRALACTDTGLTAATDYTYRVTLRTGHWHMTSRPSAPVRTQARPSA